MAFMVTGFAKPTICAEQELNNNARRLRRALNIQIYNSE